MKKTISVVICLILIALGCGKQSSDEPAAKSDRAKSYSEVGDLKYLVSLVKMPRQVRWEINEPPGNRDGATLVALLHFSQADYAFIVDNSLPMGVQRDERVAAVFYKKWIEGNLDTAVEVVVEGDYRVLKKVYALQPNVFTQTGQSPYIHGRLLPLGNGAMLLSLFTM